MKEKWSEKQMEYLSDEDLEALILSVEQRELVAAPEYLRESILGKIKTEIKPMRDKREEFRRYRMRVWTSVVAAIVLLFTMPVISDKIERSGENQNILTQVLGGKHFFCNDDGFYFFKENGGK